MRLTDADALLKEWRLECGGSCYIRKDVYCMHYDKTKGICTLIVKAPTIEAEPIVRCKDCKHWHDHETKWGDCYEWGGYSQENDYCSWGERKDEVEE